LTTVSQKAAYYIRDTIYTDYPSSNDRRKSSSVKKRIMRSKIYRCSNDRRKSSSVKKRIMRSKIYRYLSGNHKTGKHN